MAIKRKCGRCQYKSHRGEIVSYDANKTANATGFNRSRSYRYSNLVLNHRAVHFFGQLFTKLYYTVVMGFRKRRFDQWFCMLTGSGKKTNEWIVTTTIMKSSILIMLWLKCIYVKVAFKFLGRISNYISDGNIWRPQWTQHLSPSYIWKSSLLLFS